jgi:hypothetical protein
LLKGAMPDKYRDRADITLKGDISITERLRGARDRAGD